MKNKQENKNVSEPRTELKPYPEWVCRPCGLSGANSKVPGEASTWHYDVCGVCEIPRGVTQPRDFGYPTFERHAKPMSIQITPPLRRDAHTVNALYCVLDEIVSRLERQWKNYPNYETDLLKQAKAALARARGEV